MHMYFASISTLIRSSLRLPAIGSAEVHEYLLPYLPSGVMLKNYPCSECSTYHTDEVRASSFCRRYLRREARKASCLEVEEYADFILH
jgi:hypothetical protein